MPRGGRGHNSGRQKERGELLARVFIVVSAGSNSKAEETGLGSADLNHFSRLWGTGAVPSWLVAVPGVIRARERPQLPEPKEGGVSPGPKHPLCYTVGPGWPPEPLKKLSVVSSPGCRPSKSRTPLTPRSHPEEGPLLLFTTCRK